MVATMSQKAVGYIEVLVAALLWGLSGTAAQYCFETLHIEMPWLVSIRLLSAGIILLLLARKTYGKRIYNVWSSKFGSSSIVIFGVIGMFGVQASYFAAIEAGNAAVATLIQYTAPLIIMLYYATIRRKKPTTVEAIACALTIVGMFLLITNGRFDQVSVSGYAIFLSFLAALALAFYTVFPVKLLQQFPSTVVVGWGMFLGSFASILLLRVNLLNGPDFSIRNWVFITLIIIFGTVVPFYLFMESLRKISPQEASLIATTEPLFAIVATVLLLNLQFHFWQYVGSIFIIVMVVLLSLPRGNKPAKLTENDTNKDIIG